MQHWPPEPSGATTTTYHPLTMITNPWVNRITVLVVMFAIYAAGYSGGRDQAVQAHHNHPACHQNLKP